jgi:hypothetical protein
LFLKASIPFLQFSYKSFELICVIETHVIYYEYYFVVSVLEGLQLERFFRHDYRINTSGIEICDNDADSTDSYGATFVALANRYLQVFYKYF